MSGLTWFGLVLVVKTWFGLVLVVSLAGLER
jgi:hypothetical protein